MQHWYFCEKRNWLKMLVLHGSDLQSGYGTAPLPEIKGLLWASDQERLPFSVCIVHLTQALIQALPLKMYNT